MVSVSSIHICLFVASVLPEHIPILGEREQSRLYSSLMDVAVSAFILGSVNETLAQFNFGSIRGQSGNIRQRVTQSNASRVRGACTVPVCYLKFVFICEDIYVAFDV